MSAVTILCATLLASVPSPWVPVGVSNNCVSAWGRDYGFASNALPQSIKSLGRELLAAPVRVVCAGTNESVAVWKKGGSWVEESEDEHATVCAWQEADEFTVDATYRIEFDGMMKVSLTIVPSPKAPYGRARRAWLEIPLRPEIAKLYVFSPASWAKFSNAGGVKGPMHWPFRCSVWLGDEDAGLCWFCESSENLPQRNDVVEVLPGKTETVLRIRLLEDESDLPRTWVFGLQATPVKPWDRARNSRHFLHSPKMGVGLTVKRPETWWTAQRAFPSGNHEAALDAAKASGVHTVAFHEDWIPIQNNASSARPDFKALVDACHARGMKAIVYQGYEFSPLDPLWGDMHADCLRITEKGSPQGHWFREPGQRDYRVCYASGFARKWLERAKKAYVQLGLDGFYLDGTIMPQLCANARHGCGWKDEDGRMHGTYPFFAVRQMMRELYEFVEARGGTLDAHQSGYVCPATLAFAHTYWDGEQLACSRQDIKRVLDLDAFRAEFMGRNHGVPCEFLAYEIKDAWTYEDALTITLLHDVLVRPCGFGSEARMAPLWKALDDFGIVSSEWTPYWKNPVAVHPDSVRASVYERNGKYLAVVSNLSVDERVKAEVQLPPGATSAHDAVSGRPVAIDNGKAVVEIEPFRMILLAY